MGIFHNKPHLKATRNELRNNGTAAEAMLWTVLKGSQLDGRKFRRQHSFGDHVIVDFYCPSERLVIEVDGPYHDDPIVSANDGDRDQWLRENGIRVVRFKNEEIFDDVERVMEGIKASFIKQREDE